MKVIVESVEPENTDADLVQAARDAIRQGAEQILFQLGHGSTIIIQRLVISPTEFKPNRFWLITAQEVKRLFEN
ncbi:hypothetical protein GCM10027276_11430 [Comamonas piscis]